jgi:hypothetical protein
MVSITSEISNFVQANKNIDAVKKGNKLDAADLKDVLTTMPKYTELLSMYSKHLTLCQRVDQNLKSRKFIDLIKLEQMIITGLNDSGSEVKNKDIITEIEKIYKSLESVDHARLLMIYFSCYEVPEKDMTTLLSTLSSSYHDACYNLKHIFGSAGSGMIRRRAPVMDDDDFTDYSDKLASTEYEILKSTPTIAKLCALASENDLDKGMFPYVGDSPDIKNKFGHSKIDGHSKMKGRARWRKGGKKEGGSDDSKIIIFVIGGLSHHEIVALTKLQKDKDISNIIIQGGTKILTCSEFVNHVKRLTEKKITNVLDGLVVGEGSIIDHDQIGIDLM